MDCLIFSFFKACHSHNMLNLVQFTIPKTTTTNQLNTSFKWKNTMRGEWCPKFEPEEFVS